MAYIAPNTWITLCRDIPLDSSYDHTVTFASEAAQKAYFISKKYVELGLNSYQRVLKNKLRIACTMEQAIQCNYLYFSNDNFENKWFYAFITGWEYVNNATTEITYEIDVFQTFWFDVHLLKVFVEREHDNTDTIWSNTVPENVELGEYVSNYETAITPSNTGLCIVFYTTFTYDAQTGTFDKFKGGDQLVGGVFAGLNVIYKTSVADAQDFYEAVVNANQNDGIVACYMCPFIPTTWDVTLERKQYSKLPGTLDGYTPKNNKLYSYPYCLLHIQTDVQGADFRYEFFKDAGNQCNFYLRECLIPQPSISLIPSDYAGRTALNGGEFRLTLSEFPQVALNADVFKVYLAQNAASLPTKALSSALQAGVSAGLAPKASGMIMGAINFASEIANTLAQLHDISTKPPQQNGTQTSMADFGMGYKNFMLERLSIRAEYARIIDDYFDMFGYATKRVKQPNITGRPYWNYVKTIGCTVDGIDIPDPFLQEMNNAFNKGITFWHNPANVGNYSLDNRPV